MRTIEEYHTFMTAIQTAHMMANALIASVQMDDLDAMSASLDQVDVIGPAMHPTEWRAAQADGRIQVQRNLVAWARQTKKDLKC